MNYIFIDNDGIKQRAGIVEDGVLSEYYIEDKKEKNQLGNIYRARVLNVVKGMDAAFVNIGDRKNAFLSSQDAVRDKDRVGEKQKIEDVVKSGESILVQVTREAIGDKGAKITRKITIPGRYMVITPYINDVAVSNKIENREEIYRLKDIGKDIIDDGIGIIFRTAAIGMDIYEFKREYKELVLEYRNILSKKDFLPVPKLLYRELDLGEKLVRDTLSNKIDRVIVNNQEDYNELKDILENSNMNKDALVYDKEFSYRYNKEIQFGLREAIGREIRLSSGGSIVIDRTEALTAIDINTGKYIGALDLSTTSYNTNLEAVVEIARQIRLRNLGGIIIIDLISMDKEEQMTNVIDRLRQEFRRDRNRPYIVGTTRLGLLEITRKRMGNNLLDELTIECKECGGSGRVIG